MREPWKQLGHGCSFQFYTHGWSGERGGIIFRHRKDDGTHCIGSIPFEGQSVMPGRKGWTVRSEDPLTLEPSIHCTKCGSHGHIIDGKWVPI